MLAIVKVFFCFFSIFAKFSNWNASFWTNQILTIHIHSSHCYNYWTKFIFCNILRAQFQFQPNIKVSSPFFNVVKMCFFFSFLGNVLNRTLSKVFTLKMFMGVFMHWKLEKSPLGANYINTKSRDACTILETCVHTTLKWWIVSFFSFWF